MGASVSASVAEHAESVAGPLTDGYYLYRRYRRTRPAGHETSWRVTGRAINVQVAGPLALLSARTRMSRVQGESGVDWGSMSYEYNEIMFHFRSQYWDILVGKKVLDTCMHWSHLRILSVDLDAITS